MNILTPTGYKDIADIEIGEKIIGKDGMENTLLGKRLFDQQFFADVEVPEDWKWYLINDEHLFFRNQNIILAEGDYTVCHVFELQIGWKIYAENGSEITVDSIQEYNENPEEWYKLDVSGDHSFIGDGILLHNASRFWVGGGSSVNWNATVNTNWSATTGGTNNASVPGASDDVTFDGAGGGNSPSTVSGIITILSFTKTSGFTNTITKNAIVTLTGNFTDHPNGAWAGASAFTLNGTCNITSNGQTFNAGIVFGGASTTKTLIGNLSISGLLQINTTMVFNHTTAETLTTALGLTMNAAMSGTADIILTGGTWSGSSTLTINSLTFAGNVTVSGSVAFTTGTLIYSSGTITTTGSTLNLTASVTVNTNGIVWNQINTGSSGTITINSLLSATTLATGAFGSGSCTFAGTAGFTVGTWQSSASGFTYTLKNGITYTVTSSLSWFQPANNATALITSDDPTIKAILTLVNGATCNTCVDFTRIDASAGRTIRSFNGTITTCLNIQSFNDLLTVAGLF